MLPHIRNSGNGFKIPVSVFDVGLVRFAGKVIAAPDMDNAKIVIDAVKRQ